MAAATIILDTSILIDFFRKRDKSKSVLYGITDQYALAISVITAFEIKVGIQTPVQQQDYAVLAKNIEVIKHFERIPNLTLVDLPENG